MSGRLQAACKTSLRPAAPFRALLQLVRPPSCFTCRTRLTTSQQHMPGARRRLQQQAAAPGAPAAGSRGADAAQAAQPQLHPRQEQQQHFQQQTWRQQAHHPALEGLNNATKWAVSAVAFGTLLWRRDLLAAWCVLGSVVAALNCRVLKFAINEARPSDRKADPGMPSAHGNSLGFLATFVSLAAFTSLGSSSPQGLALVLGVPTLGIFLAWLRVALGYHTVSQVVAGWLVGGASAGAWFAWGHRHVLPCAMQHSQLQTQIYTATGAAVAVFAYKNVRRWAREANEHAALVSGGSIDWS